MSAPRNPAFRRYSRRIALSSALYVAAIVGASTLLGGVVPVSPLALAIALLPGLAVLLMLYAIARLLIELDDEYLRMLEVRKALVATALVLAVSSVWGLLELYTAVPHLQVFWVFPIWCMGLMVGALVNRLTLGDGGNCP